MNEVLGAFEVGVLLSNFLFGVICVQTYTYFDTSPGDHRLNKIFVRLVYFSCTLSDTDQSTFN
jgi:hypothetical protein